MPTAFRIAFIILGIPCLLLGCFSVIKRDAIVARLRRNHPGSISIQPPMAYAVTGSLIAVLGVVLIVDAIL